MTPTHRRRAALVTAGLLVLASCGDSRDDNAAPTGGGSSSTTAETLINAADCENTTQGVSATEIVFGLSHPESGLRAGVYKDIADGVRAYFEYVNAEKGGVKDHKLKLVAKDDAYVPGQTVQVVNQMLQSDGVFGFFNNVGTPNNLAVTETLNDGCVPNLLAATGFDGLAKPSTNPFTLIANPAYSTEAAIFVDHLKEVKPDAKIGLLYQNDDFGKAYKLGLEKATEGTAMTLVATESYEESDNNVVNQMTSIAAAKPDAVFLGATGIQCANAMKESAGKGFAIRYAGGTCTATIILNLAGPEAADGVLSTLFIKQPDDPARASDPKMVEFKTKAAQYNPEADLNEGLVAYGWTQAAMLVDILNASPSLDRVAVMETAYHHKVDNPPGLFLDGIPWVTDGAKDPFPIETQYLVKFNKANMILEPQGGAITTWEGRSAETVKN